MATDPLSLDQALARVREVAARLAPDHYPADPRCACCQRRARVPYAALCRPCVAAECDLRGPCRVRGEES
jgi:hypothetical protein